MDAEKVKELKQFIDQCKSNPSILADPSLSFFRDYLESLHAKVPTDAYKEGKSEPRASVVEESEEEEQRVEVEEKEEEEDEIVESDIELEGDIVEADNDPPQKMGDSSTEVTDEKREAAAEAKAKAMEAISEGKLDEAIELSTEAIMLNPSAIMYATRASVYIKMKKPNAAIRDATAALEINPDSAKGYKTRGMAHAMLGHWEEAVHDLHVASKIDFDEEIAAVLKKVEPNALRIEEHRRKYDRLRREREERKVERERLRRRAEAQDPELMAAFSDPEVMAALQDVMKNPANLAQHQANPKVAPIIAKMMAKFGGPK
ncbi:hypothetical protein CICLE_v10020471mg [Citrus x clementina]|uniref:STI1 domain-containing protein n=1 Tax=Citrus clementina TaxID=85681 RepID=V4VLL7_CITCL|nr:hypothetical protein CICLE_v10020471mg [Citrus x clementina]